MTFASMIAALSLYPWNLGVNFVHIIGTSSATHHYSANGAYIVLDRRDKDLLLFGYEKLNIRYTGVDFVQELAMVRTSDWLWRSFRPGIVAASLTSNDVDGGECVGLRVDGDVWRIGYSASHQTGHWRWYDWATAGQTGEAIHQSDLQLRYNFDFVSLTANSILSNSPSLNLQYGTMTCSWHPWTILDLSLQYGQGDSRFQTDWTALTVDNNPDNLTKNWKAKVAFTPLPQAGITAAWVKKFYSSTDPASPTGSYSVNFWVAGLQIRI